MIKRVVFFGLVFVALSAVAAAQTTIRYMTFLPQDIEAKVVEAFEAANPDIRVELEPVDFGTIFDRLRVTAAGGVLADVVSLNLENYTEFASNGSLANLESFIARDAYDLDAYFPAVLDLFRLDGALYGLPASFSNVVLFYNEDLYAQAGIGAPPRSWGWSDLLEAARKLTVDVSNDGVADRHGYAAAWWPLYIWLGGGEIIDETGTDTLIDSPEAIRGLQEMVDLWLVHGVAPGPSELAAKGDWDRWTEGTLATFPIGPWGIAPFQDTSFDWNAAHHPPIEEQATFLFSNPLAVTSQSQNQDAAWAFLKFATGPEGASIRQGNGYEISPIRSVATSLGEGMARPRDVQVFLEAVEYAKAPPRIPQWGQVSAAIDQQLNQAKEGTIPVSAAMENAAIAVRAILSSR